MRIPSKNHFTWLAGVAAALIVASGLSLVGAAASANAFTTATHVITKLSEASVGGPRPMEIDSSTHRGYVSNSANAVEVFDTSGANLTKIATISSGLTGTGKLAVDSVSHRVLVADGMKLAVIDGDPTSATVNTVLRSIPVAAPVAWLAIDEGHDRAFVAGIVSAPGMVSRVVQVVDLSTGAVTDFDVNYGTKDIAFDPASRSAFVADAVGKRIIEIRSDLTTVAHPVTFDPQRVAVINGSLLITSLTNLVKFDIATWTQSGTSGALFSPSAFDAKIAVDPALGLIYMTYEESSGTIEILRGSDLGRDGLFASGSATYKVAVDKSTHRLVTTGGGLLTLYSVEPKGKPSVERVAGADRFAVSAGVSAKQFAPMAGVAYVASGEVFSDALSASAAAGAEGGPVLLVQKDAIPGVIDAELKRLQPQRIVVLGGTATITPRVETALAAYSPSVKRIAGADRYEVSAEVSHQTFGAGRPVAYVASGAVFPDALSGSAAAGHRGGPVLLTTPDALPVSVKTELQRLNPAKIVVLGGINTVSDDVVTELKSIAPTSRTGGFDRYVVSAAVSTEAFAADTPTVFVASGAVYPDALSGGAAAIAAGAPMLLVTADTVPSTIDAELDRLAPTKIIVLGGTSSISDAVLTALRDH